MIKVRTSEEGADEIIEMLLMQQRWLICCTASDPDDIKTFILENVTRYEREGHFADLFGNPVFIEYGISAAVGGKHPYRIHDSLMLPIKDGSLLKTLINNMIKTFDVIILNEDLIDRKTVWGKIGTDRSKEIVFVNDNESEDNA